MAERDGWNATCNAPADAGDDVPQVSAMAGFGNRKAACDGMRLTGDGREAPVGVEPTVADLQSDAQATKTQKKRGPKTGVGTKGVAVEPKPAHFPPDLQALIVAWPTLPDALKAGILAMVAATSSKAASPPVAEEARP